MTTEVKIFGPTNFLYSKKKPHECQRSNCNSEEDVRNCPFLFEETPICAKKTKCQNEIQDNLLQAHHENSRRESECYE